MNAVTTRMNTVCLSLALMAGMGCGGDDATPPAPTVASANVVRGAVTIAGDGSDGAQVLRPTRLVDGATLATGDDGRATIDHDGGAWILLDRGTTIAATLSALEVTQGRVFVDAKRAGDTELKTTHGAVRGSGATFAVELADGATKMIVASGEITYVTPQGEGTVAQGETLTMTGGAPVVSPTEMWEDWTGGLADPAPARSERVSYIGALRGRPIGRLGVARKEISIRAHEVDVRILGDLAVTTVSQTFFNGEPEPLEAEYRARVPDGAVVSSFSIDRGAGYEPAMINRMSSSGYEVQWAAANVPSARLGYDGPGKLRARVSPVPTGSTVAIRFVYTEWLDRDADRRTYVYPMRSAGEAPLIGELRITTSVDAASGFRAGMGAVTEDGQVVLRLSDHRPRSDFFLDVIDKKDAEPRGEGVTAYVLDASEEHEIVEGSEEYVLFDIPTDALVESDLAPTQGPLSLVLLLDVSGGTDPEDLELARGVVDSVLRQLAPTDRVAIRLGSVSAVTPDGAPEGLAPATAETRETILASIARSGLSGATDLGESLRGAAELVAGQPRAAVLYLGDGIPTTGSLDATRIRAQLAGIEDAPRFFAFGIGEGANMGLLRNLFGEHASAVFERTEASRRAIELLSSAGRDVLRNVTLDLDDVVERVYPRHPVTVTRGDRIRFVGRLRDRLPSKVTVRGRHQEPFAIELDVTKRLAPDPSEVRRRWGAARLAELLDEDAGQEALVELGTRFGLLTPWTSFVAGGSPGGAYNPITNFDVDPIEISFSRGGVRQEESRGWRRRTRRPAVVPNALPEQTYLTRVYDVSTQGPIQGDGGLAMASVTNTLRSATRGPNGCYERKLIVRPDLRGRVTVQVGAKNGAVTNATIIQSTMGAGDVDTCVLSEVSGLRFAGVGSSEVTVTHTYNFAVPNRAIGVRRQCSDASRQSIDTRRELWRERLQANAGARGALSVWREAQRQCELSGWRARRILLQQILRRAGFMEKLVLFEAFTDPSVRGYLRRAILRSLRTPEQIQLARQRLGMELPLDWSIFSRLWKQNDDPEARIRLVRTWLEVTPDELDLRLRLLSLYEQADKIPEAKRLARELREDPLADVSVRTAVGEFWLRQEDEGEARRVFSEIVEHAPFDPWARQRLGDLYRAHGWSDDAYREYTSLARLRPDDGGTLLLLARAAADAGRIDEALRLEQRLSESVAPDVYEGAAGFARLWTSVRLTELKATGDADVRAAIAERERTSGALRSPPGVFAVLTFPHPNDVLELHVNAPSTPEDQEWERAEHRGQPYGLEAMTLREREEGAYRFRIFRKDEEDLRDMTAVFYVVTNMGQPTETRARHEVTLSRTDREQWLELSDSGELREIPQTRARAR